MSSYDFQKDNRQNILGVIVIFFQSVRRTINAYLAFFAYSLFSTGIKSYMWYLVGASLIFILISSVLRYRNFIFKLTEKQLILNSGVFTKEVTNIPLARIQSVQLHQNFIQRILGITGLKIDTAGSVAEELEIPALKKAKAEALLAVLNERIETSKAETSLDEEIDVTAEPVKTDKSVKEMLVNLDFKSLCLLAITENHVRNGFIALAVISGYAGQYLDYTEEFLIEHLDQFDTDFLESTLAQFISFILLFLVLSVTISFAQVILKFFDFKALISKTSFEIKSGLLRRNEYTVPLSKIQYLEWSTNILRKRLGFESIKIFQGRSTDATNRSQLEIPSCYSHQTDVVMEKLFTELEENDSFFLIEPHEFYRWFRLIIAFVFSTMVVLAFGLISGYYIWALVLWPLLLFLNLFRAQKYYESVNLWINQEILIYERGWLFPKRTVLKLHKIQTVELSQSIFQRRRGTCHLSFSTAAGGRSFRFFDQNQMVNLRDYLIFKTESFHGKWM